MKAIDASAVLAVIYDEPGAEAALAAFDNGLLSTVNAAEVMSKLARDGVAPDAVGPRLQRVGLTLIAATEQHAVRVAALASHPELSLADRFCIALAQERAIPLVTADRAWADRDLGVSVELIR